MYVRRRVTEEFNSDCMVSTVKHGGGSIMIWGCMTANGVEKMVLCEGHMNSEKYTRTLEMCLEPSICNSFRNTSAREVKFQQDNAPCHKSAFRMTWISDRNIELLDWPPQTPDLNPIEHLWSILKKNIQCHPRIKSKNSLFNVLQQEWNEMSEEKYCRTVIVTSMPKRIAAVIKSQGGPTKY